MLSKKSLDLILEFEVGGGENYYNKFLKNPSWPGEQSGVTIGVGYDLGYVNKAEFTNDWKELPQKDFDRLYKVVGIKGISAKNLIRGLKDISIPWELSLKVFKFFFIKSYFIDSLEGSKTVPSARKEIILFFFNLVSKEVDGPTPGEKQYLILYNTSGSKYPPSLLEPILIKL